MTHNAFGFAFIDDLVHRCEARLDLKEVGEDGPRLRLHDPDDPDQDRGFLRLWAGRSPVDRMVHVRLAGEPADTQLFFLFGRPDTVQPHFHGQVVQFGEDACIYNADLIPRLDAIEHPAYFDAVFGPITKAYWRATQKPEHACASAPGNPAIATYLSPWSIGAARPATRAELEEVGPQIHAYLDHWLDLVDTLDYAGPSGAALAARDKMHLDGFFSERLDPRAWKGVYRLVGRDQGAEIRRILMQTLSEK
jgi:hypothetical protein